MALLQSLSLFRNLRLLSAHQIERHANRLGAVVIGNRAPIDAGAHARFITVDGVSDQQFTLLVDEFRVRDRKVKERVVTLERVVNGEDPFQRGEGTGRPAACGHVNFLSLVTGDAEGAGGEQEFVFHFADVNRGGGASRNDRGLGHVRIPAVTIPERPFAFRRRRLKSRDKDVARDSLLSAAEGIGVFALVDKTLPESNAVKRRQDGIGDLFHLGKAYLRPVIPARALETPLPPSRHFAKGRQIYEDEVSALKAIHRPKPGINAV